MTECKQRELNPSGYFDFDCWPCQYLKDGKCTYKAGDAPAQSDGNVVERRDAALEWKAMCISEEASRADTLCIAHKSRAVNYTGI
jgi:hypothetical protein